jgi:hypothetical protein
METTTCSNANKSTPQIIANLENLIAVADGDHTVIMDMDGKLNSFKIFGNNPQEARKELLLAFYRKKDRYPLL